MSQSRSRPAGDALPWLADEPAPRRKWPLTEIAGWLVAAALFAGGAAYWLTLSAHAPPAGIERTAPQSATSTVPIPEAVPVHRESAPADSKTGGGAVGGSSAVPTSPPVPATRLIAPGRPQAAEPRKEPASTGATAPNSAKAKVATVPASSAKAAAAPATKPAAAQVGSAKLAAAAAEPLLPSASATARKLLAPPQAPVRQQAYNSVVHLAAFSNAQQGHTIWRTVVRTNPAVRDLTPGVIQNRDWNGRLFYQFQVGTESQAESQALCQSLRPLDLRCEVMNLP